MNDHIFSVVSEEVSKAFSIYNAFSPGAEGEDALLQLRDSIRKTMTGDDLTGTATISFGSTTQEIPLKLLAYMMASAKHLGDMCLAISKADNQE